MPVQRPAASTGESVTGTTVPAPSAGMLPSMTGLSAGQYSYVATELRTIGILTVVMVAILIVLALVLH